MSSGIIGLDVWLLQSIPISLAVGVAMIIVNVAIHFTLAPLWGDLIKAFQLTVAFRPMTDKRMGVYAPFVAPFMNALALTLALSWLPPHVMRGVVTTAGAGSLAVAAAKIGFGLWSLFVLPGIVLDYWSYVVSLRLISYFAFATLIQRVVAVWLILTFGPAIKE